MENILAAIAHHCAITLTHCEAVHGGDINQAWCLYSNGNRYFLKLNDAAQYPGMFAMEADSLQALHNNSLLQVPAVIEYGITESKQWLLLEWIEKAAPAKNSIANFGAAMASMHQQPQTGFGWHGNNYIGSLPQINTPATSWSEFYTQCRILPLVKILFDKNLFSKQDADNADAFCKRIDNLFPSEAPALLHGDLWSGNYMIATGGRACIFDPAVYCGHREIDLGMTKLFGGFSQAFYDAYNETYPLEKNWLQRLPLTQLYPLLVHAILFGGHYTAGVKEIMRKF